MARPLGRAMGVFREFKIWPKFVTFCSCCIARNIVSYCTTIYRESIVLRYIYVYLSGRAMGVVRGFEFLPKFLPS